MGEAFVGDLSNMWIVSLSEHEVGFETKQAAEDFLQYLKAHFPDLHFAVYPPSQLDVVETGKEQS